MEGMLSPDIKEEIVATVEVRDVFKITKVGTVAGCYYRWQIKRTTQIRVIREVLLSIQVHWFAQTLKDDAKEGAAGWNAA
jgi:translation initiation factor IF-2